MKVIHFHPSPVMANIFVRPLIEFERSIAIHSSCVCPSGQASEYFTIIPGCCFTTKNLSGVLSGIFRLFYFFKNEKPDIIVCHNSISALVPLVIGKVLGVRRIVYFNHGVPYLGYRGIIRYSLLILERLNMRFASQIITVSQSMRAVLCGLNPGGATVDILGPGSACGIAIDNTSNYDSSEQERLRKTFDIRETDTVFLFVGRPEYRKGMHFCLNLWKHRIPERNVKLLLCGPSREDVLYAIGSCPGNVIPLGFVSDVTGWYRMVNVTMLPSLHEGLPYSVLEGLAVGKPSIVADVPGLNDLITQNETGWLIDREDEDAVYRLIKDIVCDPSLASSKKESCIRFASRYSRDIVLKAYQDKVLNFS